MCKSYIRGCVQGDSKSRIKVECRILSEMKRVSVSIWRIGSINLLGVPVIFAAGHLLMKSL